jgi:hypothetical protein
MVKDQNRAAAADEQAVNPGAVHSTGTLHFQHASLYLEVLVLTQGKRGGGITSQTAHQKPWLSRKLLGMNRCRGCIQQSQLGVVRVVHLGRTSKKRSQCDRQRLCISIPFDNHSRIPSCALYIYRAGCRFVHPCGC